jgi:hypothetical protein
MQLKSKDALNECANFSKVTFKQFIFRSRTSYDWKKNHTTIVRFIWLNVPNWYVHYLIPHGDFLWAYADCMKRICKNYR